MLLEHRIYAEIFQMEGIAEGALQKEVLLS